MKTENEIRKEVIDACQRLLAEGLVARTWGNVSARINERQFVITPSGKAYESMKEEDLVVVNIDDCSHEGDVKPSSEKGIHADAYKLRPDINFVIHTHQFYASAISVTGENTNFAECVAYGLPGTKALRRNVASMLSMSADKSFLLTRHGALCLGTDSEDAFKEAAALETKSKELYDSRIPAGSKLDGYVKPYLDDYAQLVGNGKDPVLTSEKQAVELVTAKNMAAALYGEEAGPMGFLDAWLQRLVYKYKYSKLKNK